MAKYNRKYKKVYAGKRLKDYLESAQDQFDEAIVQQNEEKGYVMYKEKLKVKLPSIEGYAEYLDTGRQNLYNWADKYPEFEDALEEIRAVQKQRLIENGLQGTYNSTIAKLLLSHNHKMREGSDLTSDGKPINIFNDEQAERIAKRLARGQAGNDNSPGETESS